MCYVEIILDLFYLIETHPSVASDCYDVMMMGNSTDGRYTITLHDGQPMDVWCEIKPPDGWLVSNVKNKNSLQTEWKLRYETSSKIIITKYKKRKKTKQKQTKNPHKYTENNTQKEQETKPKIK